VIIAQFNWKSIGGFSTAFRRGCAEFAVVLTAHMRILLIDD